MKVYEQIEDFITFLKHELYRREIYRIFCYVFITPVPQGILNTVLMDIYLYIPTAQLHPYLKTELTTALLNTMNNTIVFYSLNLKQWEVKPYETSSSTTIEFKYDN